MLAERQIQPAQQELRFALAVGQAIELLPASMLLGAAFLLVVDTIARSLARVETPIGILTAVLGAPFFLWLLRRERREYRL